MSFHRPSTTQAGAGGIALDSWKDSRSSMAAQQRSGFLQAFGCCTETLVDALTKQRKWSSNSDSVISGLVAHTRNGTNAQKSHAARALWELAQDSNNKVGIARAGGIAPLVALARDGTDDQKAHATGTLASLSVNDDNKVAIAEAGAIPLLVALTRDGTDDQQTAAAVALANLAHNADNQVLITQAPGGITHLVALVRDGTGAQKTFADHALKQLANDADSQAAIAQAQSRHAVRSMRQSIANMTGIAASRVARIEGHVGNADQVSESAFSLPPLLPPGGFTSSFNESCRATLQRLPVCGARVGGLWPSGLPARVPPGNLKGRNVPNLALG